MSGWKPVVFPELSRERFPVFSRNEKTMDVDAQNMIVISTIVTPAPFLLPPPTSSTLLNEQWGGRDGTMC